ncbi:4Fe-4S dicluster domain-containing protein, partial [Escherichia coli]
MVALPRYRLLYSAITSSLNSSSTLAACLTPVACTRNFEEQAMQTQLTEEMRQNARALEADSILRACVHCGFCTATCPTYQLLGDELDGPRGRIYLIKQVLEGNEVT